MNPETEAIFALHHGGKIEIRPTVLVDDLATLSMAYTPGVADVCLAIAADPQLVDQYTWRPNLVAVVTDGTAVLGLGDIGPQAALPVMEGKALLFKNFGGVNAVPIVLGTTDVDEIVATVIAIAPGFGGINLEDISAPRCFEVERRLQEALDIPVFHDDQHGTAIVVLAALKNAARLTDRDLGDLRVVMLGAGAAGAAVTGLLLTAGVGDVTVVDRGGIVSRDRANLTPTKAALAAITNRAGLSGGLRDAMSGADVFVGVSTAQVAEADVALLAPGAFIFSLANPDPEIDPAVARRYASVVATGRSDHPNQINNVLAFPGVFRGALDVRATTVTEGMQLAAAQAIADVVGDELSADLVIPSAFDARVAPAVAQAVAEVAIAEGVVRLAAATPH